MPYLFCNCVQQLRSNVMVTIFSHIAVLDHECQTWKIFYSEIMYLYLIRIDCKWKHHH